MKIRSLRLDQFKKFDQPVVIDGFSDGLNLIAGPNEMGKSTLLLALRAALFERHASKTQSIKALQPNHAQGAKPSVKVELEIAGGRYIIEKCFLRQPMARLTFPDGRVAEGNEAERAIQDLLGLERDGTSPLDKGSPGHFGVMLIPQSQSFHQPTLSDGTRHTLEEAITAEIEQLGNQSEVDAVLANVELAAFAFVDRRGKPKGRYKDVEARLAELSNDIERLEADREGLVGDIDALNAAEDRLRSIESGDSLDDLRERLEQLESQRHELARQREIEANIKAAKYRVDHLVLTRDQRRKREAELTGLAESKGVLTQDEATDTRELAELEAEFAGQQEKRQALIEADQALQEKRRSFEQLTLTLRERAGIEQALQASATEVTIDLDSGALDRVRLDGQPALRSSDVRQVVDGLEIEIEAIGRISVQPKVEALAHLREQRDRLERALAEAMATLGLAGAEPLTIAPETIDVVWQETEEEAATLAGSRRDLEEVMQDLGRIIGDKRSALLALAARRQQAEERLLALQEQAGDSEQSDDQLQSALTEAEAELASALGAAGEPAPKSQPAPVALDEEILGLKRRIEERSRAVNDTKMTIRGLSERVALRAGRGLDERLDELGRRREILSDEQARFGLDANALGLLKTTLVAAATDAKAQFHAPLAARLTPYVQSLLPEAEPEVTPDFGITALRRGKPVSERFEQLSDGTREQIAILARLAFAQMLKEQGLPALVVLDDALVFSDQQRLARMFGILEKAAASLQILILTCHEDRFRGLKARRLVIQERADAA